MTCNLCRRALRWDEDQRPVMIEGVGNLFCCPNCQAETKGEPIPAPKTYPPGCRMPRHPESRLDRDMPICGLCRKALPQGQESGQNMRLRPEFVTDEDGVECGGYSACQECIQKWKPRMLPYLQTIGLLPPYATVRQIGSGLLA